MENIIKSPEFSSSKAIKYQRKLFYDTFLTKYDTATRLYKISSTFCYRRRFKGKLFRISLRTKNIKVALCRKKLIDLIEGEELFKQR